MNQTLRTTDKRLPAKRADSEQSQYLTFSLQNELFAIGILHIKEILEYGSLTPVPLMPAFIRGVINLRGAVVPVIDLAARFGGGQSQLNKRSCIVIVEINAQGQQQSIGILVDSVSEVLEIPAVDVEPAPSFGVRIRSDFISGMGKVNDKFVIILDVDHVLSIEELAQLSDSADALAQNANE